MLTRLCEVQRRAGPVTIVTTGEDDEHPDWKIYRDRLRAAGVNHRRIDFFHRDSGIFWNSVAELGELIREIAPAVIHAHGGVPACAAVMATAASGGRLRLLGQMYSWGPNRPEWMNRQDAWGFSRCDRVVVSALAYRDTLERYGVPSAAMTYLPWGLPLDELPWRHEPMRHDGPVIGFAGRIEPRKAQCQLVKAFARVRERYPAARLCLVGPVADVAYAAELQRTIAAYDLAAAVAVLGEVERASDYVRRWDVVVSLSSDEGQGLAVLEAMALGVPVVARAVPGIADFIVDGSNGIVVHGEGPDAAAAAISQALSHPRRLREIARRARRLVERGYDWNRTVDAFDRLYWQRTDAMNRRFNAA